MTNAALLCDSLFNVLSEFSERFTEEKRRKGVIDYSDIEHLTLRLLTDENGLPTDTARQCRTEYNEIYIDEYQDISRFRIKFLNAIANNNRFMVGDIKQSIYGFRVRLRIYLPDTEAVFQSLNHRLMKILLYKTKSDALFSCPIISDATTL